MFVKVENDIWNGLLIEAAQRCIFHELEQACLGNFVFVEDVEELEDELQMVFFLLIYKCLYSAVVVPQLHRYLEVVLEARRQDDSHLVGDRILVTFFEIRSELLQVAQTSLGEPPVEPFAEGWVSVRVQSLLVGLHRLRGSLGLIVCLLGVGMKFTDGAVDDTAGTLIAASIRLTISARRRIGGRSLSHLDFRRALSHLRSRPIERSREVLRHVGQDILDAVLLALGYGFTDTRQLVVWVVDVRETD